MLLSVMVSNGDRAAPPTDGKILTMLGFTRDAIDDLTEITERLVAMFDKYEHKFKPFKGGQGDVDIVKKVITSLPPEKVPVLISALSDLAQFIPPGSPEDMEKQINKIKDDVELLRDIRDRLHIALDEIV